MTEGTTGDHPLIHAVSEPPDPSTIILPSADDRAPYIYLLCNIRHHSLMYFFRMDEAQMDAVIAAWQEGRHNDGMLTFNTGNDGTWHIPAEDILFFKRITEADADAMHAASARARVSGLGIR